MVIFFAKGGVPPISLLVAFGVGIRIGDLFRIGAQTPTRAQDQIENQGAHKGGETYNGEVLRKVS